MTNFSNWILGFAIGLVMGLMMMVTGWLYEGYSGGAFYAMIALSAADWRFSSLPFYSFSF